MTASTSTSTGLRGTPSGKISNKSASFDDLVEIERTNALIKQENLRLKQEKLNLQIKLLQHRLEKDKTEKDDTEHPVYFHL